MANLLATGAGATEGLDNALHRMLLEQELQQRQDALKETTRHNQAGEADARRGQDFLQQGRQDTIAENQRKDIKAGSAEEPIGADVSPEDYTKRLAAGDPAGKYSKIPGLKVQQFSGGSELPDVTPRIAGLKSTTPDSTAFASKSTDAKSPLNAPDTIKNLGTQSQIQAQETEADRASKETKEALGPIHDTPNGLIRIGPDGKPTPILGQDGKPVHGYHAPTQPIVVQTSTGPQSFDRGKGTAAPIMGADGKPLQAPESARTKDRRDMSARVSDGIEQAQESLDEAERAGVLGPIKGRTFGELLAGKVGATGNEQTDELIGRLRMDLGSVASGFASIHSRGGAGAGQAKAIEDKLNSSYMDHALITGGLKSIKGWTDRYAKKPGESSAPSTGAADLIFDPATGTFKKP